MIQVDLSLRGKLNPDLTVSRLGFVTDRDKLKNFLIEKIDSKMTDLHRPSLWRCSVSENDTDPMVSATNPRIYLSKLIPTGRTESRPYVSRLGFVTERDKFIPTGRTESQPNVSGLRSFTGSERLPRTRRLSLGSRAADVLRRVEGIKMEINEWKISAESQLISMNVICERDEILTRLSQELAKEKKCFANLNPI